MQPPLLPVRSLETFCAQLPRSPLCSASCIQAIDTDRTGTINAEELQRAMALGGLHFSLQACSQVRLAAPRPGDK